MLLGLRVLQTFARLQQHMVGALNMMLLELQVCLFCSCAGLVKGVVASSDRHCLLLRLMTQHQMAVQVVGIVITLVPHLAYWTLSRLIRVGF